MLNGFFALFNANDLFEKLKVDFSAFIAEPTDSYKAYNFFVTAEHLPDWVGDKKLKENSPYLRICSHLATGAKHFNVTNKYKNSVEDCAVNLYVENGYVEDGAIIVVPIVKLTDKEIAELGVNSIELTELAKRIINYWEEYFKIHKET